MASSLHPRNFPPLNWKRTPERKEEGGRMKAEVERPKTEEKRAAETRLEFDKILINTDI